MIYIHGKGGNAAEAEHYKHLFPGCDVIGFDYISDTPWSAKTEFVKFFDMLSHRYDEISLIANSIGAFFAMNALRDRKIKTAYFISPIVDMEKLILDMMLWASVTEDELREKKEIPTPFGETLSWDYLCYVRAEPINWHVPTFILYGEKDDLTSYETVSRFAGKAGAQLEVMSGGEHWFHTEEELAYLDRWIKISTEE